jgi:hypothetical protein
MAISRYLSLLMKLDAYLQDRGFYFSPSKVHKYLSNFVGKSISKLQMDVELKQTRVLI